MFKNNRKKSRTLVRNSKKNDNDSALFKRFFQLQIFIKKFYQINRLEFYLNLFHFRVRMNSQKNKEEIVFNSVNSQNLFMIFKIHNAYINYLKDCCCSCCFSFLFVPLSYWIEDLISNTFYIYVFRLFFLLNFYNLKAIYF